MSTKKELQKLRGPDALQVRFFSILEWVQNQRKRVLQVLIPLAVLMLGVVAWVYVADMSRIARLEEVARIDLAVVEANEANETQREALAQQKSELQTKLSKAKPDEKTVIQAEIDKIDEATKLLKPDLTGAVQQYTAFLRRYPRDVEGWRAGMSAVNLLKEERKLVEAEQLLAEFLPAAALKLDFYRVQARMAHVGLLEAVGKSDQALTEAEQLVKEADQEFKPRALFLQARLLLDAQQQEQGQKLLEQLMTEYASAPEAQKARALATLLH